MNNTPSAFKFVNGGEVQKMAAKTGYGKNVFPNNSLPIQEFSDQLGAKGISILRGSHINP